MPAYWRTVAGPRTGPRPASRPQRTLCGGHGWTRVEGHGGQVTGRDMVTRDTCDRSGLTNRGVGTECKHWQLSRCVRSSGSSSLTDVNYEELDKMCPSPDDTLRNKNDTKTFLPLISIYTSTLSHFCPSSWICQVLDNRTLNMICCCWTKNCRLIAQKNGPLFNCDVLTVSLIIIPRDESYVKLK